MKLAPFTLSIIFVTPNPQSASIPQLTHLINNRNKPGIDK